MSENGTDLILRSRSEVDGPQDFPSAVEFGAAQVATKLVRGVTDIERYGPLTNEQLAASSANFGDKQVILVGVVFPTGRYEQARDAIIAALELNFDLLRKDREITDTEIPPV